MHDSSGKNLDQVIMNLLEEGDLRNILSAKKTEYRRQIVGLTEKLNNISKILKLLSDQNPESSILEPVEARKRSRKSGKKSRSRRKSYNGVKLAGASALTANILKDGKSLSEKELKATLVKHVKEGGLSARGVHLTLKRVLTQPDFQKTRAGRWRLASK